MLEPSSLLADLKNKSFHRKARRAIRKIEAFERSFADFCESDFAAKTKELKSRIGMGENLEKLLPEAFALVRAAARRLRGKSFKVFSEDWVWNMAHYRVQLQAGIALCKAYVAEVATGEGKTLIATLPAYLYALHAKGCHIATVNEYLARRDCEWMRPLYSLLGLSCSYIYAGQPPEDKRRAYAADITYGSSSEFAFDYLRDNSTTTSLAEKVQRGFFFCLVDEADSILVDEARTPLIISGQAQEEDANPYCLYSPQINQLVRMQAKLCNSALDGIFSRLSGGIEPLDSDIEEIVKAKIADPRNKKLKRILRLGAANAAVEQFQTRMAASFGEFELERLSRELYYRVDEKNNSVSLTKKGQDFLSQSDSRAFVMPDLDRERAAIASDASMSEKEKSQRRSGLLKESEKARERLHCFAQLLKAFALYERDVDYIVRGGKVEIVDPNTGRVMEGRRWSEGLHQAVEAKEGLRSAAESVTFASISIQNYFRMYRNLAGMSGTARELDDEFQQTYGMGVVEIPSNKACIRKENPDMFFLTKREKYDKIIRLAELERSRGRPVLVGTSSVEDSELLSRMLKMRRIPHQLLNAKNDAFEASLVARAGQRGQLTIATNMAGRGTDIKLGEGVTELGGLYIISAERQYSRRIDRQLMGRCARQGDRGETQFVLSFEDEILRKYADLSPFQKIIKSGKLRGTAVRHPLLDRIRRRTQERIEADYSGSRKSMLKFDNPSNKQRSIVYSMRDEIISSENLGDFYKREIFEYIRDLASELLPSDAFIAPEYISELVSRLPEILRFGGFDFEKRMPTRGKLVEKISEEAFKSFESFFFDFSAQYACEAKKYAALSSLDEAWREHIGRLEDLREAMFLRSYAQRDPYCEFEKDAFESFGEFMRQFRERLFSAFSKSTFQKPCLHTGSLRSLRR